MDVTDYLRIFRARWLIIVACAGIASGVAYLTTTNVAPIAVAPPATYHATTVLLQTGSTGGLNLTTLATVTTIEPVARQVADEIGYGGNPLTLAEQIGASVDDRGGLLSITASANSPERAELLANEFARQLVVYLSRRAAESSASQAEAVKQQMDDLNADIATLERRIAGATEARKEVLTAERNALITTYGNLAAQYQALLTTAVQPIGLETLQQASAVPAPTVGFQPPRSPVTRTVIAGVSGLLLGAGLALGLERLNARIRSKEAAERAFRLPVVGEIPRIGRRGRNGLVTVKKPRSTPARAFRILAASLARTGSGYGSSFHATTRDSRSILVTSAAPGDGKTTVVGNLAVAFATLGHRVLILSADFHRPVIHDLFGVRAEPGLADRLMSANGSGVLEGSILKTSVPDVRLVPSGSRSARPGALLGSDEMHAAITEARGAADIVLIDTAPLLSEGDAAQLIPDVDSVLVVARAGETRAETARTAGEILGRLKAPTAGVVLNQSSDVPIPPGREYRGEGNRPRIKKGNGRHTETNGAQTFGNNGARKNAEPTPHEETTSNRETPRYDAGGES